MITVINGCDIEYTAGDTFLLSVTSVDGFTEGAKMRFVIAQGKHSDAIIDKQFELSEDGFTLTLTAEESAKLPMEEYIYKLILLDITGQVITQQSGDFTVKWGV